MQIRQAVQRGCKLIVVDPRDIDLAKKADVHIKLKPGTNVAFANGIMHVIIEEGLQDLDFINSRTEGYEELKEIVKDYTPERVACLLYTSRFINCEFKEEFRYINHTVSFIKNKHTTRTHHRSY